MNFKPEVADKARRIRLMLLDVDGVLTDGRLAYFEDGSEMKMFHTHDGVGIRLAQKAGIEVGVITGRKSRAVESRCTELGMTEVHQGNWQKLPTFEEILERRGLEAREVGYMGDDLMDLPVLRRSGFSATVPEARPEVIAAADVTSRLPGGKGAVREVLEGLIKAQEKWENILGSYGE